MAKGENANRGVYSVCLGSEQHPATAQDRFLISLCHDTQPQFPFGLLGAAFRLQLLLGNIITTPVSAGGLCSSSTNQKAGGSNQSRHKFPLLPTVHKMKLLRPHGPLM